MKLRHITFTGIDARTDVQELKAIQKQYPIAEFGVLTSYHWYENGNRYLDPYIIDTRLRGDFKKLALHICGSAAHDAAYGDWNMIEKLVWGNLGMFGRIQLNIAGRKDNPPYVAHPKTVGTKVIIQQRNAAEIRLFKDTLDYHNDYDYRYGYQPFEVLLDASGGRGINTSIEILKNSYNLTVGYAGGINPDNVAEKLTYLLKNEQVGDFWIDMESGVRTDDWFDLDKVRRVLEICQPIIEKYQKQD